MPLRLNWFPWMETKIWWSFRSWTARLQDVSLFLLSWRLNCHFLPEVEATPPSVLLLLSVDSGWMSAVLLLGRLDVDVVDIRRGSWTPPCCLSSVVSSAWSSGNKRSVQYGLCTAEWTDLTCPLTFYPHPTESSTYLHFCPVELHVVLRCWVSLQSPRSLHCCGSHCSPWWWRASHPAHQQSPAHTPNKHSIFKNQEQDSTHDSCIKI